MSDTTDGWQAVQDQLAEFRFLAQEHRTARFAAERERNRYRAALNAIDLLVVGADVWNGWQDTDPVCLALRELCDPIELIIHEATEEPSNAE